MTGAARLNRQILSIALPSILAGITVPIVGMVDIAVAGHLDGRVGAAAFIGGVSIGSMLFDLLYWNFYFLRAGTGGLTAQAYGRGDSLECAKIFVRSTGVALAIAAVLLCVQVPFTWLGFLAVDCTPEVKELALKYFFIRVWAAPATVSLMSVRGWFIGMQDSVSSMLTDLTVNIVNVAASIVLATGAGSWEGMGFPGIALGTVIAQYSGLLFAALRVASKYGSLFRGFGVRELRSAFEGGQIRRFFSLNTDLFLRSLGLTAIYIGFTCLSSGHGDLMLASAAIMMKLLMLFSYFTDGFAYAAEALCGKYIGAQDREMTRMSVRYVFLWSMGIGAVFMLLYWQCGTPMLRLMSSDGAVVEACRQFLPWLLLMPPMGCAAFAWDGVYEGATASAPLRDSMLTSAALFFAVYLLLSKALVPQSQNPDAAAIHLLLFAYFVHLTVRTVWLSVTYKREILTRPFASLP